MSRKRDNEHYRNQKGHPHFGDHALGHGQSGSKSYSSKRPVWKRASARKKKDDLKLFGMDFIPFVD